MLNWDIRSTQKMPSVSELETAIDVYQKTITSPEIGFFDLPKKKEYLDSCHKVYQKFTHKKYFIQLYTMIIFLMLACAFQLMFI